MKLVFYLSSAPSHGALEETSRVPPQMGLRRVEQAPSIRPQFAGSPSSESSFEGQLTLHTYLQLDWYSRGTPASPTFSLQCDNHFFRPCTDLPDSDPKRDAFASANYLLFVGLAKLYYGLLRPMVGIAFDEDSEPDVLYWEDAAEERLPKLYNLTLLSPRYKRMIDLATGGTLEVHRVEPLGDGGLLISLGENPMAVDKGTRLMAEIELGFHPDVDPATFRSLVAFFDEAAQREPERLARELGLAKEDIETGKSASLAAGLPRYAFLNLYRLRAIESALEQAKKTPGTGR